MSLLKQNVLCTSFPKNVCHRCSVSPLRPGESWNERYQPTVARQRECTGAGKEPVPKIRLLFRRHCKMMRALSFSLAAYFRLPLIPHILSSLWVSLAFHCFWFCCVSYSGWHTALDLKTHAHKHTCWISVDKYIFSVIKSAGEACVYVCFFTSYPGVPHTWL